MYECPGNIFSKSRYLLALFVMPVLGQVLPGKVVSFTHNQHNFLVLFQTSYIKFFCATTFLFLFFFLSFYKEFFLVHIFFVFQLFLHTHKKHSLFILNPSNLKSANIFPVVCFFCLLFLFSFVFFFCLFYYIAYTLL